MMVDVSDNPAEVMREMLDDPEFRRRVCRTLGVSEDTEIDEESFKRAQAICEGETDHE
jgi:hypothetical protein